jgi:hypothetical protein
MQQYRFFNPVRADIVDILRFSQTPFGDQARLRYQALILTALQALTERVITITDATQASARQPHDLKERAPSPQSTAPPAASAQPPQRTHPRCHPG